MNYRCRSFSKLDYFSISNAANPINVQRYSFLDLDFICRRNKRFLIILFHNVLFHKIIFRCKANLLWGFIHRTCYRDRKKT